VSDFREQVQKSLGSSYTIDRELGGGGMSRVYVAHDTTLRRDVVVKVLPPDLVAGVNVERFRREILMAAGLQHPHIVPVLSSGETDGLPWFTMPFVQGESLRDRLKRGPLPIAEVVSVMREVAKALAYAHERGVVHRDIKPDNVLLTGGTAVVTDFGIAKALSASRTAEDPGATRGSLTQVGMSIGTPMYMAPEQAAADPHTDARADIYSFGCVAYELLSGRPPFVGMSPQKLLAAHMGERPQNVAELRRDTPPLLGELVMHCLEKEPGERPSSAADLVRLLDVATTTSGSAAAASAVLLGGRVRLRYALAMWAIAFGATWILAKAAIVGIGLPNWVLPSALVVAALGLPSILFTAFVQRTAHSALIRTPTLTPGGTMAPQGTMVTIAMKASPHVSWKRTVRGGVYAFGAFVLLVVAVMILRAFGIGPAASLLASGRISAREQVLVTDFSVRGGDSTLAGIVAEAMRSSLSQSNTITLVAPGAIAGALARMQRPTSSRLDMALARDVAAREGIRAIVDGDVAPLAGGYVVSVRLVTADSGRVLATAQKAVDGPKELITAVDAIGRELRGKLGESLRSVQNAPRLDQVTTPSIDALRAYSEAVRAYDMEGDYPTAIARLTQAVTIDSGFAMAWRKLGAVYNAAGYSTAASDSVLARAFHFRDRLSQRERLSTEASYYYLGPGKDRARAIAASLQLMALGDSVAPATNVGLMYESRRQFATADSFFNASIRNGPSSINYIDRAANYASMGQMDRARAGTEELAKRYPSPTSRANALAFRAFLETSAGDYDAVAQFADSAVRTGIAAVKPNAYSALAVSAAVHGQASRFQSYLANASDAIPAGGRRAPLGDSLQLALFDVVSAEQTARGLKRVESALARTLLASLPPSDRDYLGVATLYAVAGRADRAKAVLAQRATELRDTTKLRAETPDVHRVLAQIAIAENRPKDAIREIWKGDSLPDGPYDECDACTLVSLARAYDKASMADSAIYFFEKSFAATGGYRAQVDFATRAPAARRLGELYEAKGDKANAVRYYRMFVQLWKDADAELQPQVNEVKKRLARLERNTG
jgi:eukaryotic-like serine/threonine-protein kinase